MDKFARALGSRTSEIAAFRLFAPTAFSRPSRLTFKQLRRPTRLPTMASATTFGRYLDRLNWLFGAR